jgi:hypothetical protein
LASAVEVKIPAQCTQLHVIDREGRLRRTISYGISENLRHLPPREDPFP